MLLNYHIRNITRSVYQRDIHLAKAAKVGQYRYTIWFFFSLDSVCKHVHASDTENRSLLWLLL